MWTLFLLSATIGCGYSFYELISTYKSTPVSTTMSPGAAHFQDPDVTVGPGIQYSFTSFYETFWKKGAIYLELMKMQTDIQTLAQKLGVPTDYDTIFKITRDTMNINAMQTYFGVAKENFIVHCVYKEFNCSFEDFQKVWGHDKRFCFRFAPTEALINQTRNVEGFSLDLILFTDNNPTYFDTKTVEWNGKPIVGVTAKGIDTSQSDGAILYYGENDSLSRNHISFSSGRHSFVNFDMVEYRYVNRDSKQCFADDRFSYYEDAAKNRIKFRMGKSDCQYRNLIDQIIRDCGCLAEGMAIPYFTPNETVNVTKCYFISPSTNTTEFKLRTRCVTDILLRTSTLINQMTDCDPNCVERTYKPIFSSVSWPIPSLVMSYKDTIINNHMKRLEASGIDVPNVFNYLKYVYNTFEEFQPVFVSNFVKLSVGASRPFSMVVEEFESYPMSKLLSSLSGNLGLYLGMSLLTLCELFELILVLISEFRTAYHSFKNRIEWKAKFQKARDRVMAEIGSADRI